jgi:hypothetical protein
VVNARERVVDIFADFSGNRILPMLRIYRGFSSNPTRLRLSDCNGVGSEFADFGLSADRLGQWQKPADFNWIVISSVLQVNLSSCRLVVG